MDRKVKMRPSESEPFDPTAKWVKKYEYNEERGGWDYQLREEDGTVYGELVGEDGTVHWKWVREEDTKRA